jgi:hypothetical protein
MPRRNKKRKPKRVSAATAMNKKLGRILALLQRLEAQAENDRQQATFLARLTR